MAKENLNQVIDTFTLLEPQVRVQKRAAANWEELVVPNFVPSSTETVAHIQLDYTGDPKEITGKSGEKLPIIGFASDKDDIKVRDFGFALEFDMKDEKAMLAGNINPMREKTNAAFVRQRKFMFDAVVTGKGISGASGLANAPITGDNAIATATRGALAWSAPAITGDQVLDDLNALYNAIGNNTDGVSPANTLFLPLAALQVARTKKIANSSDSALTAFLNGVQDATGQPFLVRMNQAFGKDMFMGSYGEEFARIHIARTLEFGEPQPDGWGFTIPCRFATSGVEFMDRFAFGRMPGVL